MILYKLPLTAASTLSAKYSMLPPFNPAIEIRPSAVMYTCAFSARALVCGGVRPVKLEVLSALAAARGERGSPKHSDLTFNVSPFSRSLQIVSQRGIQLLPHADDPVGHAFDFRLPLGV